MKSMKKILALVLCILMLASMGIFTANAETKEADKQVIYFEEPKDIGIISWDSTKIFCHIWEYGGDSFAAWQSKKEACSKTDTEGLWMYDITAKGFEVEEGKIYGVIFSNEVGLQTYDTLFDVTCIGDTLYCKGEDSIIEAPSDSAKKALATYWKNADPAKYGPIRQLTSIGNVVGECFAPGADAESLYTDFIVNKLETTLGYVTMTQTELLAHASSQLGISAERAYELELDAGLHTPVTGDELPLPSTDDQASEDEELYELGDVNRDGKLNIKDATAIQKFVAKIIDLDQQQKALADFNGDTKVNVKDATMIQKKIANLI